MNTGFVRPAVATVLTVYGIETFTFATYCINTITVATVLTVYGIETDKQDSFDGMVWHNHVATVLTVYGIETTTKIRV